MVELLTERTCFKSMRSYTISQHNDSIAYWPKGSTNRPPFTKSQGHCIDKPPLNKERQTIWMKYQHLKFLSLPPEVLKRVLRQGQ